MSSYTHGARKLRRRTGLSFRFLATFLSDDFIERWPVLTLCRLATFAPDFFVELGAVFGFYALSTAASGFANAHPALRFFLYGHMSTHIPRSAKGTLLVLPIQPLGQPEISEVGILGSPGWQPSGCA